MTQKIKNALGELDTKSDDDWTAGGLPSMDRMKALVGDENLTRAQVSDAAPGFNRANAGKSTPTPSSKAPDPTAGADPAGPGEHPADRPIEDQGGPGNVNDATMNAERRDPAADASGGMTGKPDDPEYRSATMRAPDANEIAQHIPDAIVLFEAAVIAASAGRYARNSALQTLVRGYQVAQREVKEVQGRIDIRLADREKANAAAAEATAKENAKAEAAA